MKKTHQSPVFEKVWSFLGAPGCIMKQRAAVLLGTGGAASLEEIQGGRDAENLITAFLPEGPILPSSSLSLPAV